MNVIDYIPSIVAFSAVLIALVGRPKWDPKKGAVMVGSDADIVIWDPKGTKTITAKKQVSRFEYNVFEGNTCTSIPKTVLSRGRVAWEQGDMRAKPGDGDFVVRPPNAPVHVANAIWKGTKQPKPVQRVEVTP